MNFRQQFLLLNLAMLCISTSGALGRFIALPAPLTIWWRAFFATIILSGYCMWRKFPLNVNWKKDGVSIVVAGFFMAAHWVTYFLALRWANVAVGMLTLFTSPIIIAFLEPIFFRSKLQLRHIFLSVLIILGVYFLAPDFNLENDLTKGVMIGLVSALCFALRSLILKSKIESYNGSVLITWQMIITTIVLLPTLIIYEGNDVHPFLPHIVFLGLITTAIGHTLYLNSLKFFKVTTASILGSVQPIYGIIIAIIFLNEVPEGRSIIGGILILSTVVVEALLNNEPVTGNNEQ